MSISLPHLNMSIGLFVIFSFWTLMF